MQDMNMTENARLIQALRSEGWSDSKINDLVLYMETGEQTHLDMLKSREN